jgi:hypothetical protein
MLENFLGGGGGGGERFYKEKLGIRCVPPYAGLHWKKDKIYFLYETRQLGVQCQERAEREREPKEGCHGPGGSLFHHRGGGGVLLLLR